MKHISLEQIGMVCYRFRRIKGFRQKDVANDLGLSEQAISAFEHGRNNSAVILLCYLRHGLSVDDIVKGGISTWEND